jgi:hypothetical protein
LERAQQLAGRAGALEHHRALRAHLAVGQQCVDRTRLDRGFVVGDLLGVRVVDVGALAARWGEVAQLLWHRG